MKFMMYQSGGRNSKGALILSHHTVDDRSIWLYEFKYFHIEKTLEVTTQLYISKKYVDSPKTRLQNKMSKFSARIVFCLPN